MKDYNHELELAKSLEELKKINSEDVVTENENNNEENIKKVLTLSTGDTVILDLDSITGNTVINAKSKLKRLRAKSAGIVIDELDDLYYILIAEAISELKYDKILAMKYNDFSLIKNTVRDFLLKD